MPSLTRRLNTIALSVLPQLLRLGLPIALSRITILLMVMIDIAVVGHFASDELGFQAAGTAVSGTIMLVVFGLVYGVQVQLAQAHGRGEAGLDSTVAQSSFREMGRLWRFGLLLGLFWAALGVLPAFVAEPFLLLTGQEPEVAAGAARIWLIMALSVPFAVVHKVTSGFLEVLKRPGPALIISLFALSTNLVLNLILVRGWGPIPPMGAEGSALGTLIIRLFEMLAIVTVVLMTVDRQKYGLDVLRFALPLSQRWRMFKVGLAVGASQGIEASAFTALVLMAGWLGATALGGFNIAFNLLALLFMISLGLADATAVLVGNAVGASDKRRARAVGYLSWSTNAVIMVVLGVGLALFAGPITGLLTSDVAYIAVAAPLVLFVGFIHIVDGGQVIFSHANRAAGDSWISTGLHICSYWGVMIPAGYLFSQTFGFGVAGLMMAVLAGSVVSNLLLAGRFLVLTRAQ